MGDTESRTKIAESTARQWQQGGMPWEGGKGKKRQRGRKENFRTRERVCPGNQIVLEGKRVPLPFWLNCLDWALIEEVEVKARRG